MVLLIIDVQEMIISEELYEYKRFEENLKTLIEEGRNSKSEVIYVRHDNRNDLTKGKEGFEIPEEFAPETGEKIFDKHVNSPFKDSGLLEYLKDKNERQIMVTGLQTDYCFDVAVKCGFEHGFEVFVPEYCNTTVDNEFLTGKQTYEYYNTKIWNNRYASCISMDEALKLLR